MCGINLVKKHLGKLKLKCSAEIEFRTKLWSASWIASESVFLCFLFDKKPSKIGLEHFCCWCKMGNFIFVLGWWLIIYYLSSDHKQVVRAVRTFRKFHNGDGTQAQYSAIQILDKDIHCLMLKSCLPTNLWSENTGTLRSLHDLKTKIRISKNNFSVSKLDKQFTWLIQCLRKGIACDQRFRRRLKEWTNSSRTLKIMGSSDMGGLVSQYLSI